MLETHPNYEPEVIESLLSKIRAWMEGDDHVEIHLKRGTRVIGMTDDGVEIVERDGRELLTIKVNGGV